MWCTCLPTVWLPSCFTRLNCFFAAAAAATTTTMTVPALGSALAASLPAVPSASPCRVGTTTTTTTTTTPGPWLRPHRVTSSSAVRQPLPGWVGSGRVGSGEEPQALGSAQRGLRLRGPSLWLPDAPAAQSGPLASRGSAAWCPHGPLGPRCHFAQRSPAPGIFNSLSRLDLKHKVEKADTKSVDRRTHHRWRPRTSKTHPRD